MKRQGADREELPARQGGQAGRRSGGGRGRLPWRARQRLRRRCARALQRPIAPSTWCCTPRRCRCSRIAVHGNVRLSTGEVQALVDGLRGTSILTADLLQYRARLMESPWVADVALRRVLPSTVEVFVSERRPIGLCRLGSAALPRRPQRHGDRRVRPAVRASSTCRSSTARSRAPSAGEPAIDERRSALAARVIDALAADKDLAAAALADRRVERRTTRSCCSTTTRRCCTSARRSSPSGCRLHRARAGAAADACRTSTTWTCGSTIASTSRPAGSAVVQAASRPPAKN